MNDKQTVLLVESCRWRREMLSSFLTHEGFQVLPAANGVEAVEQLRLGRPGVLLFEARAMELDRWRVIHWLRARGMLDALPLVAICETESEQAGGRAMGADVCLCKPLRLRELASTLRRCSGTGKRLGSLCARLLGA